MDWIRRLVGAGRSAPISFGTGTVEDLARRVGRSAVELRSFHPAYRTYQLAKRSGGHRTIRAPDRGTRDLQRAILRKVLASTPRHPLAYGFAPGSSAVEHARRHVAASVVLRMDIEEFFGTTAAGRVRRFFAALWDEEATDLLVRLTTVDGALPQGAPTSPALADGVNLRLDHRLEGFARANGARYSRYADDITFSLQRDDAKVVHALIRFTEKLLRESGYRMHRRRKLHVRRAWERQIVGGLVVNGEGRPRLPRARRRWLRAVEHRLAVTGASTLTDAQLVGWRGYQAMVDREGLPLQSR